MRACSTAILGLSALFSFADEPGASKRFEKVKTNGPALVAFLAAMPKGADLHIHTSGAVDAEDSLKEAIKYKLYYNPSRHRFQQAADKGAIPAAELANHGNELNEFLNDATMRGFHEGGAQAHDHFFATFGIFGSAWSGTPAVDMLEPVLRRAQSEHLLYLEFMMNVAHREDWAQLERGLPDAGDLAAAYAAVQPRLKSFVSGARSYLDEQDKDIRSRLGWKNPTAGTDDPVCFRYVATLNRNEDNATFFAEAAADMALIRADKRVVSLTILAPEDDPRSEKNFRFQMRALDFLWRRLGHPNMNLHGGELTPEIATLDDMRDRIRTTITLGHARRVGHAVALAWDYDPPSLLRLMRNQKIAVECCFTSNDLILNVKGKNHPFRMYYESGVPVTINTDDEGVSRSNMTLEYAKAVEDQRLTYKELKEIDRNGLEYSFLPGKSLYLSVKSGKLLPEFRDYLRWHRPLGALAKSELASSPKMRMELKFEIRMRMFESGFGG